MSRLLNRELDVEPEIAVRGDGLVLRLADGREILDASGGAAVACLGHGNRRVADAVGRQVHALGYAHTGFFNTEASEALAELLLGGEPGGLSHALFVSSGSEAMEAALKLGRQYFVERGETRRVHYISRRQSYHGNTFGALAASGNLARRAIYEPLLPPHFSRVSPCFAYHGQQDGESDAVYVARLAAELEDEFQRIGPDRVIGFCAETVVGATAGCVAPVPGYFRAMREICDRHGALLILDEVMCGMGRCGTQHAWEQEGVTPDIQAIGKGLGGGYQPVAGILVAGRLIDGLRQGSRMLVHGHTYQAHPVACAAALEVQTIIREQDLLGNVRRMGARLAERLDAAFGAHPHVGDRRGRGLFHALEFVEDRAARRPFPRARNIAGRIKQAALEAGVGIYPTAGTMDGTLGDHAIVAPPYIVTEAQIDEIVDRLHRAVQRVLPG